MPAQTPAPMRQGVMNSAMLGGYLAGQIPAGFLSDMLGGERWVVGGCAFDLIPQSC